MDLGFTVSKLCINCKSCLSALILFLLGAWLGGTIILWLVATYPENALT